MKQSCLGLSNATKRTGKLEFLDTMELVVPWTELVSLIEPYAPDSERRGQQPFAVQALLRIHFIQQWFKLSDPAMEEALHEVPAFRDFADLSHWDEHIPSESSILRFRQLLECHKLADQILAAINALLQAKGLQLKAGTVVDATLIAAPTSTKNEGIAQAPEMHQSKKGNEWYFGINKSPHRGRCRLWVGTPRARHQWQCERRDESQRHAAWARNGCLWERGLQGVNI